MIKSVLSTQHFGSVITLCPMATLGLNPVDSEAAGPVLVLAMANMYEVVKHIPMITIIQMFAVVYICLFDKNEQGKFRDWDIHYSRARDRDGGVRFLLYSTTICRCRRDMKVTVVQSRVPLKVGHGCNLQFGRTAVHV